MSRNESTTLASAAPVPEWGDEELLRLRGAASFTFDPHTLRGRDETMQNIRGNLTSLMTLSLTGQNHGLYKVFVASGHVRSGKTRIGQEVFKCVNGLWGGGTAVYIPVTLGNGNGFDVNFDPRVTPSQSLGARIAKQYSSSMGCSLKAVNAGKVINALAGEGEDRGRPIVVHIDEHGQYIHQHARYWKRQSQHSDDNDDAAFIEQGREAVVAMLDELVGIANSMNDRQRLRLVVVLSGTSLEDVSPHHDSKYQLVPLKLPVLSPKMCSELASE